MNGEKEIVCSWNGPWQLDTPCPPISMLCESSESSGGAFLKRQPFLLPPLRRKVSNIDAGCPQASVHVSFLVDVAVCLEEPGTVAPHDLVKVDPLHGSYGCSACNHHQPSSTIKVFDVCSDGHPTSH